MDREGAVGIATRYGLDGLWTESRWGGGGPLPHPSRPDLGPKQSPAKWVQSHSQG